LALRGGGPDNVTVVVADVVDYDYGQTQPILAGAVSGDDDQSVPPNTAAGRASAFNPRRNVAKRVEPPPEEPVRAPRSRRRMFIAAALLILVVLAGLAIGREIVFSNYYVAAHDGTVSIMRGVPADILGYHLQEPYRQGCLKGRNDLTLVNPGEKRQDCTPFRVSDLKPNDRQKVTQGLPTVSEDEAINQITTLARDSLLPVCEPPPPPPSPSPVPHSPAPTNSPGVPNNPEGTDTEESEPTQRSFPEVPQTISPSPGQQDTTSPDAPTSTTPASPQPPAPSPTGTALPPLPQQPGTNCRELP
jgi:protein phosphatase